MESVDDSAAPVGADYIIIRGKTYDGGKFRPSDWPERLHSTLRALGEDEQEYYSEFIHLVNYEGGKCVLVDCKLEEINPALFGFFIRFAKDNHLTQDAVSQQKWRDIRAQPSAPPSRG